MQTKKAAWGFLALAGWVLTACSGASVTPAATELAPVEVRQYEGQNLSSVDDFRENSISGPQQVALDDYRLKITGLVERPLALSYDQVLAADAYSRVVTLYCVEGWHATILWEGVRIADLLADTDYRGYWESRGYDNNGDQGGSMFEP